MKSEVQTGENHEHPHKKGSFFRRATAIGIVGAISLGGAAVQESGIFDQKPAVTQNMPLTVLYEGDLEGALKKDNLQSIKEDYDQSMSRFKIFDKLRGSDNLADLMSAFIWSETGGTDAAYAMKLLTGEEKYQKEYDHFLSLSDNYWDRESNPPSYSPVDGMFKSTERYTDDNLWVGLQKAREYKMTGNKEALSSEEKGGAVQVFDYIKQNWDEKEGGIYWMQQNGYEKTSERGSVSNSAAIILAVDLYQATGDKSYFDWAERIYEWMNSNLKDKNEGLYSDNIDKKEINWAKWSYNQGVMVGAMTKLNEVDPVKYPIKDAVDLAKIELDKYSRGAINDRARFRAIDFQYMLYLSGKNPDAEFSALLKKELYDQVRKETKKYSDLCDESGRLQLRIFYSIPETAYGNLA